VTLASTPGNYSKKSLTNRLRSARNVERKRRFASLVPVLQSCSKAAVFTKPITVATPTKSLLKPTNRKKQSQKNQAPRTPNPTRPARVHLARPNRRQSPIRNRVPMDPRKRRTEKSDRSSRSMEAPQSEGTLLRAVSNSPSCLSPNQCERFGDGCFGLFSCTDGQQIRFILRALPNPIDIRACFSSDKSGWGIYSSRIFFNDVDRYQRNADGRSTSQSAFESDK
jgi:hypothetical protein